MLSANTNLLLGTVQAVPAATRAPYETPVLINLGDVRDITLGGSPGSGDSGNPGTQRF
jgi:hypothetical protein